MALMSLTVSEPKDPVVLSYRALRKAVGIVAVALPFALVIPYLSYHVPPVIQGSLSAYYYTDLRNVFVGSLCAIAMFMLCTRGYDKRDERAGFLAAICAIGVAFFPMDPEKIEFKVTCATDVPCLHLYPLHFVFASILFATLGYFCLWLFRISVVHPTKRKLQRNRIYTVCGVTIYTAMAVEFLLDQGKFERFLSPWLHGHHLLVIEVISLWAFGYAWLVKGEAFFKDVLPKSQPNRTTDDLAP
jgi:hypothetical protein